MYVYMFVCCSMLSHENYSHVVYVNGLGSTFFHLDIEGSFSGHGFFQGFPPKHLENSAEKLQHDEATSQIVVIIHYHPSKKIRVPH